MGRLRSQLQQMLPLQMQQGMAVLAKLNRVVELVLMMMQLLLMTLMVMVMVMVTVTVLMVLLVLV